MDILREILTQLGLPEQLVIVAIVAVGCIFVGWKWRGSTDDGEIRALKAELGVARAQKELAEDRLEQVDEQSTLTAKALADMQTVQANLQTKYAELERQGGANKAELSAIRTTLSQLQTDTGTAATAIYTTQKIVREAVGTASGHGTATAQSEGSSPRAGSLDITLK
jgi:hypothetical protein